MEIDSNGMLGEQYPKTSPEEESQTKERILLEATMLFAQQGYAAVSMRDIAAKVGIRSPSLYNHYASKEAMWDAVLAHVRKLYLMYFSRLEATKSPNQTVEQVVDTMFVELKSVVNIFTYYGFSLVQTEQFRDEKAGGQFLDLFLEYSIAYIKKRLDACIESGKARKFDSQAVASMLMHTVLIGIDVRVHEDMGRRIPYDVEAMFSSAQRMILDYIRMDSAK